MWKPLIESAISTVVPLNKGPVILSTIESLFSSRRSGYDMTQREAVLFSMGPVSKVPLWK